ncbi:HAD-IC family P-type ATPase [Lactobacillus sp. Marseille-P7033]|nr:HAD-IC family P-type ATPase [Lactobacillus sp. Marseille-P7033]
MKENYQLTTDEIKKNYQLTDFTQGLSKQAVDERLAKDGRNIIEVKPTPKWKLFLRQFNNIVIYILLAATLLTILIGHYTDAIVIGAVVILNALIGYFQESSAANALAKIKEMMAQHATVYRDGKRQDIDAADLVRGDVVFLEAGDNVPADLRIVSADNLRIEESALTGETNSVIKTDEAITDSDVPLADRVDMAYASTSVTSGSGLGVVVATGEQTEIGKISQEVAQIKPKKTPLTKEIDYVGKVVSYITITASVIVFIVGFFLEIYSLPALALAVVAMLVGAIPEGLPAITSVILAFGISKMAREHQTIIKSMPAVETLGSVDVIATDKTGTLTKNEMTAIELWVGDNHYTVTGTGYAPNGKIYLNDKPAHLTDQLKLFLEAGYQANDTVLTDENGTWHINGEPTDVAKDAADMILGNDNFAVMAAVIKEGRRIYDNIKKSILFLLPTSFAEGLVVAFSILTGQQVPLQPAQLLWINLIAAITIQFAFVFEKAEEGIMDRKPRPITQRLMNRHDLIQMGYVSALMAIFALIGYEWFINSGADIVNATTMMVNTIVISKAFYFFSIRTERYGLKEVSNIGKKAWGVIGLMILFQLIFTYVPFMQAAFHVTGISLMEWLAVVIFSCLIFLCTEADKMVRFRLNRR